MTLLSDIRNAWKASSRGIKLLTWITAVYAFIAILAPLLANEKPVVCSVGGELYFPVFNRSDYFEFRTANGTESKRMTTADWRMLDTSFCVFAPVPFSPSGYDLNNIYAPPLGRQVDARGEPLSFRFRHWLGTGKTGNDVLAGLIHGTSISLRIGFLSMLIAGLIGIVAGLAAGYFGDYRLKVRRVTAITFVILLLPAWFYAFHLRSGAIADGFDSSVIQGVFHVLISLVIFTAISMLSVLPSRIIKSELIRIPVDRIISGMIEVFLSLPRLVLIIVISSMLKPSAASLIMILGLVSWTEIARLVRSGVLKMRESEFTGAATALGLPAGRILRRHIVPNIFAPVIVMLTFGVAGAILTETGLSFLGIGLPPDKVTWGSLLYSGRENFDAWWLVIFPGLTIFLLLSSLYSIADSGFRKQKLINKI